MLQYRALNPGTLELLKKMMQIPELQDFFLVGGTALALHLGHRISFDIDLFTTRDFNTQSLFIKLDARFSISDVTESNNTLNFNITYPENSHNVIKVDLIKYAYPLINPIQRMNNIRLLSIEDIIPMKLSAIAGRGSKRDFYDIFYLLRIYSLKQMFDLFEKKFPTVNTFYVVKSLTYFEDAELEANPQTIEPVDWEEIKHTIIANVNAFAKK